MSPRRPRTFFALVFIVLAGVAAFLLRRYLGWSWTAVTLTALNLAVFPLWAFDKWQAGRQGRRVPEAILHLVALCGAALASLAAMRLFRHKTRKRHFWWLYFTFLALQIGLLGYFWRGR